MLLNYININYLNIGIKNHIDKINNMNYDFSQENKVNVFKNLQKKKIKIHYKNE